MAELGGTLVWYTGKKGSGKGEFASTEELAQKIMKFIKHYNRTGKPFKWTYKGKVLTV